MDPGGAQAGISLVVVVHSMIAAACLTLAAVQLPVWLRNRDAVANLAFAIAAAAAAANAIGDLVILKAQTPEIYAAASVGRTSRSSCWSAWRGSPIITSTPADVGSRTRPSGCAWWRSSSIFRSDKA
jgi:Tfp pilus assembly protein PilX